MAIKDSLTKCPKCGCKSIFIDTYFSVDFDGNITNKKLKGKCNNPKCEQKMWYHPSLKKIIKRKPKLAERIREEMTIKYNYEA